MEAIRQLVSVATDDAIAGLLNRNGLRTGNGNRWTRERICSLRTYRKIPIFRPAPEGSGALLTLNRAAAPLEVAPRTLRLAAEAGKIDALHPLAEGPWLFQRSDLTGSGGTGDRSQGEVPARIPRETGTESEKPFHINHIERWAL